MDRRIRRIGVSRASLVLAAAALVAVPTLCGCRASNKASACALPNQRQLQATMSSVEARADVTSFSAFGPSCDSTDSSTLSAERNYPYATGIKNALESALSKNGWTPTPERNDDRYFARIENGQFVNRVVLSVQYDENDVQILRADFLSNRS